MAEVGHERAFFGALVTKFVPGHHIFGEAGHHTRSAVGMAELPFDIAVEIELIAELAP